VRIVEKADFVGLPCTCGSNGEPRPSNTKDKASKRSELLECRATRPPTALRYGVVFFAGAGAGEGAGAGVAGLGATAVAGFGAAGAAAAPFIG